MRSLLTLVMFVLLVGTPGRDGKAQEFAGILLQQEDQRAVWDIATNASGDRWAILRQLPHNRLVEVLIAGARGVTFEPPPGTVCIAFMHDGTSLVTSAGNITDCLVLWTWDEAAYQYIAERTASFGGDNIAASPGSNEVLLGALHRFMVWDGKAAKPHDVLRREDSYSVLSLCYSPDGRYVAAGFAGALLCLRDQVTGAVVWEKQPGPCDAVAFSADGRYLAWAVRARGSAHSSTIFVRDLMETAQKGRPVEAARMKVGGYIIHHLVFHDDWLISGGAFHYKPAGKARKRARPYVSMWNVSSNEKHELISSTIDSYVSAPGVDAPPLHQDSVKGLVVSRGHNLLLVATFDGIVSQWRLPVVVRQAALLP